MIEIPVDNTEENHKALMHIFSLAFRLFKSGTAEHDLADILTDFNIFGYSADMAELLDDIVEDF